MSDVDKALILYFLNVIFLVKKKDPNPKQEKKRKKKKI